MELVKVNFDTDDIIQAIIKCHELYKSDTVGIARKLKGNSLVATCSKIHDYVYRNINYKLDKGGVQFAKRPNRTLTEKEGDCKSMSLLAGSLLYNLGVPFSFRFASYDGKEYTHVYIVAHGTRDVIIDPVWTLSGGAFDTEKQYVGRPKDFKMKAALYIGSINKGKRIGEISDKDFFNKFYPPVADMLVRLNRIIDTIALPEYKANAKAFLQVVGSDARNEQSKLLIFNGYANMFLSGKSDWATTFKALAVVMAWKSPLGIGNIFSDAWNSTKDFVNNVGDKVGDKFRQFTDWAGNVVRDGAEAAASAAKRVVNKARDVTVQFASWGAQGISDFVQDPSKFLKTEWESLKENAQEAWNKLKTVALAPARLAFLGLVRLNVFGFANALDPDDWDGRLKTWKDIGGNRTELQDAIRLGRKEKAILAGIAGIGFAAAIAADIAAAAPVVKLMIIGSLAAIAVAKGEQLGNYVGEKLDEVGKKLQDGYHELLQNIGLEDKAKADKTVSDLGTQYQTLQDLGGNPNMEAGMSWGGVAVTLLALAGMAYAGSTSGKRK